MAERGITSDVAEDIYEKILRSPATASPSRTRSASRTSSTRAWLKCYYPAAFTAALLRAQPMGFYSPASLISDVRRHGVEVRGVDVNASAVLAAAESNQAPMSLDSTALESHSGIVPLDRTRSCPSGARLGRSGGKPVLAASHQGRPVRGAQPRRARRRHRGRSAVPDLEDFARRTRLPLPAFEALATAGRSGASARAARGAVGRGAAASIRRGQLPGQPSGMTAPRCRR